MSVKGVLRVMNHHVAFYCPGCQEMHVVSLSRWKFNGNYEKPSFTPSMIIRNGHYAQDWKPADSCWCEYYKEHPDEEQDFCCGICHWIITDGVIQFQGDCTHPLAGKAVPMEAPAESG